MSMQFGFWLLQGPGWLLVLYLVIAQCVSAVSYDTGVRMGAQEPASEVTAVGRALFWAFAFADLVVYTPLLALGLIGHLLGAGWTDLVLGAALGITVYWPIVSLATVKAARNAPGWSLPKEAQYWVVLPLIALWGFAGLVMLGFGG